VTEFIRLQRAVVAVWLLFVTGPGCGRGEPGPADNPSKPTMKLGSPVIPEDGMIPAKYTCDGLDRSPPLEWSGVPGSARSLALICDDPDAPLGTWSHWVVTELPPEVTSLAEGISPEETVNLAPGDGARAAGQGTALVRQGKNDFGNIGYGGPCPPSGTHRYLFRLYALDTRLELGARATRRDLLEAIQGHILAEGRLTGRYHRTKS
jgi:Raf kinase inhibitor-like YbhB/YbcL family protein